MSTQIEVVEGDITRLAVDAIVNAANDRLARSGGVCGAIHAAAGPALEWECQTLGGCATGGAKITRGYNLPAKWVIHAVGPIWQGGHRHEADLLAQCYHNSLKLAEQYSIETVAFPAISTGIYGYPLEEATRIAITEVKNFLKSNTSIEKVIFVCRGSSYECYLDTLAESENAFIGEI
jgi:O-acetyl-ADP-ribose deacetylase (regulator of RNase III)